MNVTQQLHAQSQSLWLDHITHALLTSGTLACYIREFAVTGLTSNPTIFDHTISDDEFYDDAIRGRSLVGKSDEALFFEPATEDLVQAADLFRPVHEASGGIDGWASLEVLPSRQRRVCSPVATSGLVAVNALLLKRTRLPGRPAHLLKRLTLQQGDGHFGLTFAIPTFVLLHRYLQLQQNKQLKVSNQLPRQSRNKVKP